MLNSGKSRERFRYSVKTLKYYNIALVVVQLATSVILFFLAGFEQNSVRFPLYASLPGVRPDDPSEWMPDQRRVSFVRVAYLPPVFLLFSAFQHAITLIPPVWNYLTGRPKTAGAVRQAKSSLIESYFNPVRWFEYMISASLMHFTLALLVGVFDVHLLFSLFVLMSVVQLLGLVAERYRSRAAYWIAWVPFVFVWLVLLCYFSSGALLNGPPWFVWLLVLFLLALDIGFGVNQGLMLYRIVSDPYVYEVVYLSFSLVSKQLMAWILFSGIQASIV